MTRWLWLILIPLLWSSAPEAQVTRHVYLTPVDGAGTDADPYRSRCEAEALPNRGNIDLRDAGINRFLCASDVLPTDMTGVQELGSAKGARMTGPRKTALEALTKKPLSTDTVDEAIGEILASKLRAGRDGKIKVWLGEKEPLYQQTAWVPFRDYGYVADVWNALQPSSAWATTLATETWNCADSGDLTCVHTWTEFFNSPWTIASNHAVVSATTSSGEVRNESSLATSDMEVQVTVVSGSGTGTGQAVCRVIARKDNTSTRTFYAYGADFAPGGTQNFISNKRVSGTSTTLATTNQAISANDVIRLRVEDTSISGYVNGILTTGPITDTSITSGTYAGIAENFTATNVSCTLGPWIAFDYPLPSSNGAVRRRNL